MARAPLEEALAAQVAARDQRAQDEDEDLRCLGHHILIFLLGEIHPDQRRRTGDVRDTSVVAPKRDAVHPAAVQTEHPADNRDLKEGMDFVNALWLGYLPTALAL